MFERGKRKSAGKGLSIIIVGCGKVGKTLVERLEKEGHDLSIIDSNPEVITQITNTYDVMGIVGNGASYTVQMEAGITQADVLIAVTGSDELNLLCCLVGKRAGNCDVIARVRTPDYSEDISYLKEKLGLAMIINPEREAANAIARILYMPTALEVISFSRGLAEMMRIKLPANSMLTNHKISELSRGLAGAILICAVERGNAVYIPDGSFELKAGDVISFISPVREGRKFLKRLGLLTHHVRDSIIIGGGTATYYLAKQLIALGISVKIIETDKRRCDDLSMLLPEAVIINGDGSDEDLLKEVGIQGAESVISLTGIDEENILLTLYAQRVSNAKVITKINRINFHEVINELELGSVIYPKYITTEAIVRFVRSKKASMNSNIEALTHLFDDRVEVIEFVIEHESRATDVSLAKLELKDNTLVTCIKRNGKVIIPNGGDCLQVGDAVIVVTAHCGSSDILDILK